MSQREADRPAPVVLHQVRRSLAARPAGRALRDLRDVRREDLHRGVRPLAPADEPWAAVILEAVAYVICGAGLFIALTAR